MSKLLNKSFLLRTLSGVVLAIIVPGAVLLSPYTMIGLMILIGFGSLREFYNVALLKGMQPQKTLAIYIGLLVIILPFLIVTGECSLKILIIFAPLIVTPFIIELYRKTSDPMGNIAWSIAGIVYIAVPLALIATLPISLENGYIIYRPLIILSFILIVWANDVGAYLVGVSIGKHRLFERISPKKSWEGFFGGIICAMSVGALMGYLQSSSMLVWAGLGLLIAITGVYGDLVESMIKRSVNMKDSGNIIPGHGGFLDRFDALILAAPFIFIYFTIFTSLN